MEDRLTIALHGQSQLTVDLAGSKSPFDLQMTAPAGTTNYERLRNLPQINGVQLVGNKTLQDLYIVSENTSAGWDDNRLYIPKTGEICVYSDIGRIKIGDGAVPVVDLPFISQTDYEAVMSELNEHTQNNLIHVSQQDRERWDNKLNYTFSGEELILTRL